MTDPGEDPDEGPGFFADRLAEAVTPWACGPVTVPVPDGDRVAELDEVDSALDVLDVLCPGDELFDALCDHLDAERIPPGDAAADALTHFRLDRAPEIGWHALVERINCYGAGIEFDLWDRGWDLGAYFAGRVPGGWDHLLRVIDRLPTGSHYRSALADDDELARRVLERYGPRDRGQAPRPALAGFDQTTAYLHKIDYRLSYLAWAVFAAQAGKKRSRPPKPDKGPETAAERAEFSDFLREHDEIVSQVLKRKGPSDPNAATVPAGPAAVGDGASNDEPRG